MKNIKIKMLLKNILVWLLLFSTTLSLFGCGWFKPTPSTPVDPGTVEEPEIPPYTVVENKYFIENGVSEYVIVYASSSRNIKNNVVTPDDELRTFFTEATGVPLDVYEDGTDIPEGKKIISLGDTSYAEAKGFSGKEMERESFRIVTDNEDNIYIVGEGYGVLWGVYELLNYMFDYVFYKDNVWYIDHGVRTLNFFTVDHTVVPNIAYVPLYHGQGKFGNDPSAYRYRHRSEKDLMVEYYHNAFTVLAPDTYSADHPGWYSTGNDQLCYTARGNEEELALMTETVAQYFAEKLREETNKSYACFSMMDTHTWCACDACIASEEKYQSKSAAMLIMSQNIAERINEILHAEGDTRNIKILPMIYNAAEDVPVVLNDAGEYELIDPTLDFSNVIPLWAAMSLKSHAKPWSDPENAAALEMVKKLDACFDEFWLWDYGVNFRDYFVPLNIFNNLEEDFKLLEEYNISMYLYQCDHVSGNATSFGALRSYLLSELMMDPHQDVEKLTNNFFENVYGEGAEAMKELYDQYRLLATYNSADHGDVPAWDEAIYSTSMITEQYFPRGVLREWIALLDEAHAAIEAEKSTNINGYYTHQENIILESIFVRYIYARLYLTSNNEENIAFKLQLYNDVSARFSRVNEGGSVWALAVTLGIDYLLN